MRFVTRMSTADVRKRLSSAPHLCVRCWPLFLVAIVAMPLGVSPYSSGAPENRCSSMVPGHFSGGAPSYTDPFTVTVSVSTYSPLKLLQVTIQPRFPGLAFRGFFIQARNASSPAQDLRYGYFLETDGESRVGCNSGASTHAYSTDRTSVTVSWRAPPVPQGNIVFSATVVRMYNDYYTGILSPVIVFDDATTTTTTTTNSTTTTATPQNTTTTTRTTPTAATTKFATTTTTTTTTNRTTLPGGINPNDLDPSDYTGAGNKVPLDIVFTLCLVLAAIMTA